MDRLLTTKLLPAWPDPDEQQVVLVKSISCRKMDTFVIRFGCHAVKGCNAVLELQKSIFWWYSLRFLRFLFKEWRIRLNSGFSRQWKKVKNLLF
jgi:hypothetical protein